MIRSFLFFFFFAVSVAASEDVIVAHSVWTAKIDGHEVGLKDLNDRSFISNFDPNSKITIAYRNKFSLINATGLKKAILVLPATWLPIQVQLNGEDITPSVLATSVKTKIYELNKVDISGHLLRSENILEIVMVGSPILQGFRGGFFDIYRPHELSSAVYLRDFLLNSIHYTFFCSMAFLIGCFTFLLINFLRKVDAKQVSLGIASFAIVPYHLLTSDLYSNLFANSEGPFKFQIYFQAISWLGWGYFLIFSMKSKKISDILVSKWVLGLIVSYFCVLALLSSRLTFNQLSLFIMPSFAIPLFVGPYWLMKQNRHTKMSFMVAFCAVGFGYLSFISHVLQGNFYFLGYSITFFMGLGFYDIAIDFVRSSKRDRSAGELLNNLLPTPVFTTVTSLLSAGAGPQEIRTALRGDSMLTTVFVDICSYGEMSLRIPSKVVYAARTEVFESLKQIADKHDHYFIKSIGDCAHFAGGFGNSSILSQSKLATSCLHFVREILDQVDSINIKLKTNDLPLIKVKISAAIGHGEFGLEGTNQQIRYDIVGHWVNVTKRLEEAMTSEFYKEHGQNVALVSANLFSHCEDVNLRMRFMKEFTVVDKHGTKYSAFIGTQYSDSVKRDDFLKAVYGQFSHQEDPDKKQVA